MDLEMEFSQSICEPNALKVICTGLSRPPEKIVEVFSVVGVTRIAFRKSNHGINRVIPDIRQQARLANLFNQLVESTWNRPLQLAIETPTFRRSGELRSNPRDSVVRVWIDA
jgi:hypothetical protein